MKYLIDTNTVIYLLKNAKIKLPFKLGDQIVISFITKIELLSYNKISIDEERNIQKLIENSKVIFINNTLINNTIMVRKNFSLKLPDSIIVATSIQENAILVTSDKQIINKASKMKIEIFDALTGKSNFS